MKSGHLFKKIIGDETNQLRINIRKLLGRYSAKAVHDLRVAAMRTDFALKLFGQSKGKGAGQIKKITSQLKEMRRTMGESRNLDILSLRTEENLKDLNSTPSQTYSIKKLIQSRKDISHQHLMTMLGSLQRRRTLKDLKRIKDQCKVVDLSSIIKGPFKKTVAAVLKYRRRKIHARNLHKIRIAFKKLRYACEFLEEVDKLQMQKAVKFIVKFQDLLGERQNANSCVALLSKFDRNLAGRLIKMEKVYIKDCQKKFEKLWERSFLKPSMIEGLYRWSQYYP